MDLRRNNTRDVQWMHLLYKDMDFKVPFRGIMINNHKMANT